MSVIQIDKDYVVVGSVRLPRRTTEKQEKETSKVPPEAKGETVDLPMTVLQQLQAQMDALQNQVNVLQEQRNSTASEQKTPYSAPFLGSGALKIDHHQCFVAIPYSKPWSKSLQNILSDICKSLNMKALVAKEMNGRFVPHDIWTGITGSGLIIADITDGNPNVAYEIGLADVLGKEVVLLCQGDNVPFDFQAQRLIIYENTMDGSLKLKEELVTRLRLLWKDESA